mmetsp:Transcript_76869/g.166341  ORF Transcript_76869/g.166341 Transcript_76869/m.166341 type:complete len:198 (-) Transcript_76869:266-859(-)
MQQTGLKMESCRMNFLSLDSPRAALELEMATRFQRSESSQTTASCRRETSIDSGSEATELTETHEITIREPFTQESSETYSVPINTKNGFVHYFQDDFDLMDCRLRRSTSCSAILPFPEDSAKQREIDRVALLLHETGKCNPCAYYKFKGDGCRNVLTCNFCHLCSREEIKTKKRQHAKRMKQQHNLNKKLVLAKAA